MRVVLEPWTGPDPQPGDFDAYLTATDPRCIEVHGDNPDAKLTIVLGIEDEDAERLQQLATCRCQRSAEVVAAPYAAPDRHCGQDPAADCSRAEGHFGRTRRYKRVRRVKATSHAARSERLPRTDSGAHRGAPRGFPTP